MIGLSSHAVVAACVETIMMDYPLTLFLSLCSPQALGLLLMIGCLGLLTAVARVLFHPRLSVALVCGTPLQDTVICTSLQFPFISLRPFILGSSPPPIQSCGPHSPSTTFIKSTPGGVGLFGGGLIATQLEGRHAVSIGIALTLCCCGTAFAKGDHFPRFCNGNGGKLCVMHSCNVLVVNLNC